MITHTLGQLRGQLLVASKGAAGVGDYVYEFCSTGKDRARQATRRCAYFGSAPVPWNDYLTSVLEQSARKAKVGIPDLCKVFSDIMLSPSMINQIGQAVYAGKGLFLYGPPGNGKTSIAERVVLAVADSVWIPRTIIITGEIIRLYDPACHELADDDDQVLENLSYDMRWVRIKRPSLIIGGELTLDQFESKYNPTTGINEAPIQLKSNGGTLVIDDFGRQRVDIAELLNRWIVPLAKGVDFMTLNSGRQIEMPFEQLLTFVTNLAPKDVVDEAFLRRMPYKIRVGDPSEREFRTLMADTATRMGLKVEPNAIGHLLSKHYHSKRPMRFCHVNDLLLQVKNLCHFQDRPLVLSSRALDIAVHNYFTGMEYSPAPVALRS